MKKKTQKHKKNHVKTILFFLFPALFLILGTLVYVWYQSRSIPDLDEQYQMTVLPPYTQHVLGALSNKKIETALPIRIPIFLYHYVEYVHNDPGRQNLNIPPNILTKQIETLKNAGYSFITANDLALALAGKKRLPQKIVMLTFDDGYIDFYTDVFPILQKENVAATEYVVPNFLDRPNYLFTYQLKEIARSPLVEIGAHTMDHYALAKMNTKEATYEITQSRNVLRNLLHLPIDSFAYPYGSFDADSIQIVKNAGFTNAMSTIPGIEESQENEYFLSRLRPGYRTGSVLLKFLTQNTFQAY